MIPEALPFAGLRVVDCGSFIASPATAALMGDLGADVIKIEPPGQGDPLRRMHLHPDLAGSDSAYPWDLISRNKRSLALDLKAPEALEILLRLTDDSDVFVTNFPPRVRERLGIGHDVLSSRNPGLIYAAFTGHGEDGPDRDKPGFDSTAFWSRSGLMRLTGPAEADPPRFPPGAGDQIGALSLFGAISAALYRRERTGQGGMATASLMGTGYWVNAVSIQGALAGAGSRPRPARTDMPNACFNSYRCRDGRWLVLTLANGEARGWPRLVAAIERTDLLDDPRFATPEARASNAGMLIAEFDAAFATRDRADWEARLGAVQVVTGSVQDAAEATQDVQAEVAGLMPEAAAGRTVATPIGLDGAAPVYRAAPREVGIDGDAILDALGVDAKTRARLRAAGQLG